MSDSTENAAADSVNNISPRESLPDVKPPTAGFILQLFVIPGVIVFVIVIVVLLFRWLAHMGGGDPYASLEAMKKNRSDSWQQAHNLIETLRQSDEYKQDDELAKAIAHYLIELDEVDLPAPSAATAADQPRRSRDLRSEEIARRGVLCKALGEFFVAEHSLPVLIRLASKHEANDDLRIRLAALESIALLAETLRETKPLDNKALMPMLLSASQHPDHKIALRAVLGLGALATEPAIRRLAEIMETGHVDVQYNAATSLARHGNAACVEMLEEMLDPTEDRGLAQEEDAAEYENLNSASIESRKKIKRAQILKNALLATRLLAEKNKSDDLSSLEGAVADLADADIPESLKREARKTLRVIQSRGRRTVCDGLWGPSPDAAGMPATPPKVRHNAAYC